MPMLNKRLDTSVAGRDVDMMGMSESFLAEWFNVSLSILKFVVTFTLETFSSPSGKS